MRMAFIPPRAEPVTASAPGNMILMGEYAVVEGARAVMMTLKKRLTVTLTPSSSLSGRGLSVVSDRFGTYDGGERPPHVALIANVLAEFGGEDFHVNITSDIPATYGFGSSAALVAALVRARGGDDLPFAEAFTRGHRAILKTHGRGSGADLAAALADRPFVVFDPAMKSAADFSMPFTVQAIYTGYKTPTPEVLKRVNYQGKTGAMRDVVEAFIVRPEVGLIRRYQAEMAALGVVCDKTQQALEAFEAAGCVPKISGSGLGDCVVGFSAGPVKVGVALPLEFIPAEDLQ